MRAVDRHGRPLIDRDASWLTAVSVVTLDPGDHAVGDDPHRGFVNAMGYHLAHGTLVVDHWHAIRLANACVDDVRRRVQQDTLGHRRCNGDPLYGVVGCSRRPSDSTDRRWRRHEAAWTAGDPRDEVDNAWAVKELLRDVYAAPTVHDARVALGEFSDQARGCGAPKRTAGTHDQAVGAEILAWHTTGGASNGPGAIEAIAAVGDEVIGRVADDKGPEMGPWRRGSGATTAPRATVQAR